MSSFSSVVHKPGKKIVPRAAPRRNVQRRQVPVEPPESSAVAENASDTQRNDVSVDNLSAGSKTPLNENSYGQPNAGDSTGGNLSADRSAKASAGQSLLPHVEISIPVAHAEPSIIVTSETQTTQTSPTDDSETQRAIPETVALVATVRNTRGRARRDKRGQKRPSLSEASIDASTRASPASTHDSHVTQTEVGTIKETLLPETPSARSSKRQRTNPSVKETVSQPQDAAPVSFSPPTRLSPSVQSSDHEQSLTDLLQSATRRAASVSELANDIESRTRSSRLLPEDGTATDEMSEREADRSETPSQHLSRVRRKGRKKTLQEQAAEVVANAVGSSGPKLRERALTPEDAADYELEPASVRMGDLCKDTRLGKKSALEAEMQANWPEILQRRKEDRERAIANAEKRQKKAFGRAVGSGTSAEPVAALAPAMTVVNGVIVVDQSSREIDRGAQLQQAIADNVNNIREDKDYYKYVNSNTVGMKPGHGAHAKWDTETTELFFKGLRMFGTDFLMISNMFPGVTRKQIKMKFIREEKADKARVLECLRNREPVELEDYANLADKEVEEFQTLESIQKELEEQEKQLREEDTQRRKREGFVTNTGEIDEQSARENGQEDGAEGRTESAEPGRFDSVAREIMEAAVAPKKRQRKPTAMNSKRGPKHGRRPESGIEEVLGSITEVAV